ncbi:MAG TPA: helix-turn-helix domain-containing protein [Pedobacter sp.]|jgi:transcriptional regulator with XRE-family HTH domain
MKQPELGIKLAEIRKEKGITQEDLVQKCNVTVRTIQRIESGDVTPRPLTLKLIAEALDCDWNTFSSPTSSLGEEKTNSWIYRAIFTDLKDPNTIALQLNLAWIAGIIYFLTGFPESAFEYDFFKNGALSVASPAYIMIKVIAMAAYALFARGFIIMGYKHHNNLLTYGAYLFLSVFLLNYIFDIFSLGWDESDLKGFLVAKAISFGIVEIIFGLGLIRIKESFGRAANYSGYLEIIAGLMFITVALSPFGLVVLIPAEILEVYLLFQYSERLKPLQRVPF